MIPKINWSKIFCRSKAKENLVGFHWLFGFNLSFRANTLERVGLKTCLMSNVAWRLPLKGIHCHIYCRVILVLWLSFVCKWGVGEVGHPVRDLEVLLCPFPLGNVFCPVEGTKSNQLPAHLSFAFCICMNACLPPQSSLEAKELILTCALNV